MKRIRYTTQSGTFVVTPVPYGTPLWKKSVLDFNPEAKKFSEKDYIDWIIKKDIPPNAKDIEVYND